MELKNSALRLHANENPLGASPLAEELWHSDILKLNEYPDSEYSTLRSAIGKRWRIDSENIILGAGSDELIDISLRALLHSDSKILAPQFSFKMYKIRAQILGAEYLEISLDNQMDLFEDFSERLKDNPDVIVLVNPSNPIGKYFKSSEIIDLVSNIPDSTTIIIDEAYAEFTPERENSAGIQIVKDRKNTICLRTFSKAYGLAGLRLGWAYVSPDLVKRINSRRSPYNVSALSAHIGEYSLNKSDHLDIISDYCNKWSIKLITLFYEYGLNAKSEFVNFIFVDFIDKEKAKKTYELLLDHGFLTSLLSDYKLDHCIRISFSKQNEMVKLYNILEHYLSENFKKIGVI